MDDQTCRVCVFHEIGDFGSPLLIPTRDDVLHAGADAVGSNCGQGTDGMLKVAQEFSRVTELPLLIQANAGLPILKEGVVQYPESPADMAAVLPELIASGVKIVGGCCGSTPAHIGAIREALDQIKAGS